MTCTYYTRNEPTIFSSRVNWFLPEGLWFVGNKRKSIIYTCKIHFYKKEIGKAPLVQYKEKLSSQNYKHIIY